MAAFKGDSIFWIETHKIVPNPYQPRKGFDEERLKELSESIRMYGVLQPLTVSRIEVHDEAGAFRTEYELIAGERRLRASKLAGLEQVPVIIREGDESEQEKLELAIIENLQREDLNAVDRALAFRQLADVFGLSHQQVAKKVGRSREYVSNSIRLLGLPDYMLESLKIQDISEGHARTLLMLNDRPEEQDTLYREILLKKLTVREVERIARKIATDKVRNKVWKGTDPDLIEKERVFTETLGTRVQLTKTDYGGKITIDYFSDEDLDTLLEQLASQKHARALSATAANVAALEQVTNATPLETSPSAAVANEPHAEVITREPTPAPVPAVEAVAPEIPPEVVTENPPATPEVPVPPMATPERPAESSVQTQPAPEPVKPAPTGLRAKLAQMFGEAPTTPATVVATTVVAATAAQPVLDDVQAEEPSLSTEPESETITSPADDDDTIYDLKNFSI